MKALVMGGTEFVSSSMAKYLISKGYVVDIFTRGIKTIEYSGFRKHLKGDRKIIDDLRYNFKDEKYDYVFDVSAYTREDVEKLISVLDREKLKRYVFCSSGAVYTPSEKLVSEDFTSGENINWGSYGLGKKEAEDYLLKLYENEKFPITIFRPTYIYGEGNNLYRECYLFDRITQGLDIPIPYGDKNTQFIYISDLVKTFEISVHSEQAIGQAYNITHPQIVTWQELVETAMRVINKKVNIVRVHSEKENISAREYFPFRNVTYLLDIKKAETHGLHIPQISLEEGIELAYKWYCNTNPRLKDPRMDKINLVLK